MCIVYAHRGASAIAPENTMEAFLLAISQGSQGIELDVHLTKDHIPVIMHDESVNRTTNGQGDIKDYTFDELYQLNANNNMASYKECHIPTLEQVLSLIKETNTLAMIELKTNVFSYSHIEEIVIDLVQHYHVENQVIYSSFNPITISNIKRIQPDAFCGFLYELPFLPVFSIAKFIKADALHPKHTLIKDASFINVCHKKNLKVNTWTVNTPHDIKKMKDYKVDGIITNYPKLAQ